MKAAAVAARRRTVNERKPVRTPRKAISVLMLGAIGAAGVVVSAAPADASTVIGAVYEHQNWGGARLRHLKSADGYVCTLSTSDVDADWVYLGDNWDNRVSSFRDYADCWTALYSEANFGGISYPFSGDTASLGVMDNQATSIRYT